MKKLLKAATVIILSAVSAYLTCLLLLVLNIIHYYELSEPKEMCSLI